MGIRYATVEDIPIIRAIAFGTWPVAYKDILSEEQLHFMLERSYGPEPLSEQLLIEGHRFLIASHNGVDIGFASYQHGYAGRPVTRIHKLYVLPDAQGSGAGKRLVERIIEECRAAGSHGLELNVNRYNPSIGFYQRLGFAIVRSEVIPIGQGYVMDDHVMSMVLSS